MAVAIPAVPVLVGPVAVVLRKQVIVTDYKLYLQKADDGLAS